MRSKVARRIQSETPEEVRDGAGHATSASVGAKTTKDFRGVLSDTAAAALHEHIAKCREEWESRIARELEDTIGEWEKENNIAEADYEKLSQEHLRTPYRKPI